MAVKKKKNWIQNAIGKPGALHRALGVPMGQPIPASKMAAAMNSSNPKIAKMANLAKTLMGLRKKKK